MHEYRLLDTNPSSWPQKPKGPMRLDDWVLCRVRHKGSTPRETGEKSGSSGIVNPSDNQNRVKQPDMKENGNSLYDWSDYQLLAYLLNSQEDGEDNACQNSNLVATNVYSGFTAEQAQPSQQVRSVLESIKRTLSFGALDEIMLMPPT